MSVKLIQLDLFAKEKEAREVLQKQQEEKNFERRLRHLFGRMAEADTEIETQWEQIEQLWQAIRNLERKTP